MALKISDHRFTRGEACALTHAAPKFVDNVTQREIFKGGKLVEGRRLFSIIDLIQLKVLADCAAMGLDPSLVATTILDKVQQRAKVVAELTGSGGTPRGYERNGAYHIIVRVDLENGRFMAAFVVGYDLAKEITMERLQYPSILVPVDRIAIDVALAAVRHVNSEEQGE
jgi:hypothetical protein